MIVGILAAIHRGQREEPPLPLLRGRAGVGALSAFRAGRGYVNRNQARFSAIIENSSHRRGFTIFDPFFVEHTLQHRVGRSIVPMGIVIEIEPDRCDRATSSIGASPTARGGHKFNSDFEVRVFHQRILAQSTRSERAPTPALPRKHAGLSGEKSCIAELQLMEREPGLRFARIDRRRLVNFGDRTSHE
jgi:hypothetical protein